MSVRMKGFLVLSIAAAAIFVRSASAQAPAAQHFVIAFNQESGLPANVDSIIRNAGGTITERVPEIGGIGVVSSNPSFAAAIAANASVKSVDLATSISLAPVWDKTHDLNASGTGNGGSNGGQFSPAGPAPQPMPDSLGSQQWDKMRMNATLTGSYAVQRGRHDVKVAVIDTGADVSHIDVAANLDVADSASFVPTEPFIQDLNGHGTWTISAVGAPINGVGISGVAPNVTLVELKVLSGAGSGEFIWVDQALVYAGLKHFDIASMSLGGYIPKCGSPKNPNCDHPDYILLNRAVQFARSNGVLPVAALGNDGFDLSEGNFFRDFIEAPGEVAGVVGVAATGFINQKAFYSNYGMGKTDVSAPGGSTRDYNGVPGGAFVPPPFLGIGRLIGAWSSTGSEAPSDPFFVCTGPGGTPPCFLYGYVQGTSMATPNVAGVAALIISQFGDFSPSNKNKPHMNPTQVESMLQMTANNQPCPDPRTVIQGPGFVFLTATCQGNPGYNSFFGKGIVDALRAVTAR
jgi:subtilisin family serine protease